MTPPTVEEALARPRRVRENTLTLDYDVITRNVGFRSPLAVRARLWWRGLTCRARAFSIDYYSPDERSFFAPVPVLTAHGWQDCNSGVCYVTRVEAV